LDEKRFSTKNRGLKKRRKQIGQTKQKEKKDQKNPNLFPGEPGKGTPKKKNHQTGFFWK